MRISVFTPIDDPKQLHQLEESLRQQSFQDFEWIIVPHRGLLPEDLSVSIPQASVATYKQSDTNIGFLKSFACSRALGEIVVEVHQGDELFPTALAEVDLAFRDDTDFAYSNFCDLGPDGSARTFERSVGWESRRLNLEDSGAALVETVAFSPGPASFSKIWFAPNHLRAWRTEFYREIGGHSESMSELDDHEIICRSYIAGKVKHIDKPLYLSRSDFSKGSCFGEYGQSIQIGSLELHDKFIYPLVERWCDLNGLRKLDLRATFDKPRGYESIDTGDKLLDGRWPFADGELGVIRAHEALSRLKNPVHIMSEAYRCLAPNGWLLTLTPSTDGRGAFQDPANVSFWNSNSFWYFTRAAQAQYIGTPTRFQLNRIKNFFPSDWHQEHNIPYVKADLLKFSGRTPGPIEI